MAASWGNRLRSDRVLAAVPAKAVGFDIMLFEPLLDLFALACLTLHACQFCSPLGSKAH
jgi:hypothetical protein